MQQKCVFGEELQKQVEQQTNKLTGISQSKQNVINFSNDKL